MELDRSELRRIVEGLEGTPEWRLGRAHGQTLDPDAFDDAYRGNAEYMAGWNTGWDEAGQRPCTSCGTLIGDLERFPGGVCVECHAKTPEGRRMPTADEVRGAWGIK